MFLQHFDYFHYYSNHNVHATAKKKKMMCVISTMPPVHILMFHQASLNNWDPDFSRQTDRGQTDSPL